jgi:hypothetical protein
LQHSADQMQSILARAMCTRSACAPQNILALCSNYDC